MSSSEHLSQVDEHNRGNHPYLELDQLRYLATQYYRLYRQAHRRYYEIRNQYRAEHPDELVAVVDHRFKSLPQTRDAIDAEQMYGRFTQINATMYLMEAMARLLESQEEEVRFPVHKLPG